jgi:1,4-dihydroxy-2-naphthoate octaprenyltransferase
MQSYMISPWILAARPKTLPAAVMPVLLGSALAWHAGGFAPLPALICLGFALLVQIGTNYANDYYDGIKGTDTPQRLGPTRAVASGLIKPEAMWRGTLVVLGAAFVLGLTLVSYGGWWLVAVGAASLLCALAYTGGPYPLGYHGWGDVFVIAFFGLIAVAFTFYVQTGAFAQEAWLAGLAMGLVVNNILVVNNYRDEAEDRRAGKRTLVVRFGRRFGLCLYAGSYLVSLLIPIGLGAMGYFSWPIMLIMPASMIGIIVLNVALLQRAQTAEDFNRVLAQTAKSVVFYGISFSAAVLVSR